VTTTAPATLVQALWAAVGILVTAVVALWRGDRGRAKEYELRLKASSDACDTRMKDMEDRLTKRIVELELRADAANEKRITDLKEGAEAMQEIVERNTKVLERVLDRISRPG
jgi:uncharacterized coiled-coil protein SlyX